MGDPAKLPKWAQAHIENLEMQVERWRLIATASEVERSDTIIRLGLGERTALRDGTSVEFGVEWSERNGLTTTRGGRGPILAGCTDYAKRFKDEKSAEAWIASIEADPRGCRLEHHVLAGGDTEGASNG